MPGIFLKGWGLQNRMHFYFVLFFPPKVAVKLLKIVEQLISLFPTINAV